MKKLNIIDVREDHEFSAGHYKNAISIPLSVITSKVDFIKELEGAVLLYCRSGIRSNQACVFLKEQGVTDVYNAGGLDDIAGVVEEFNNHPN